MTGGIGSTSAHLPQTSPARTPGAAIELVETASHTPKRGMSGGKILLALAALGGVGLGTKILFDHLDNGSKPVDLQPEPVDTGVPVSPEAFADLDFVSERDIDPSGGGSLTTGEVIGKPGGYSNIEDAHAGAQKLLRQHDAGVAIATNGDRYYLTDVDVVNKLRTDKSDTWVANNMALTSAWQESDAVAAYMRSNGSYFESWDGAYHPTDTPGDYLNDE